MDYKAKRLARSWHSGGGGVPIAYFALFPLSERLEQANKRQKLNVKYSDFKIRKL